MKLPIWVMTYLANLEREGQRLACPIDVTEIGFDPYPAFGFACGTVSRRKRRRSSGRKVFSYSERSAYGCEA